MPSELYWVNFLNKSWGHAHVLPDECFPNVKGSLTKSFHSKDFSYKKYYLQVHQEKPRCHWLWICRYLSQRRWTSPQSCRCHRRTHCCWYWCFRIQFPILPRGRLRGPPMQSLQPRSCSFGCWLWHNWRRFVQFFCTSIFILYDLYEN